MPDAVLIEVAKAVTSEINGEDFGVEFTAVRSYADWDERLEDLDELHVDVVPVNSPTLDIETAGSWNSECSFDIGIRKRFDSEDQDDDGRITIAEIDELVKLTQDIATFFMPQQTTQTGRALADYQDAAWSSTEIKSYYSRRDLREHRQYTSIIRTTYTVPFP